MSTTTKKSSSRKRYVIGTLLLVGIGAVTAGMRGHKIETVVQTAKVTRGELTTLVTASGEIKPLKWVNISATAFGPLSSIKVKEGERVKAGQLIAEIENVQPTADVAANRATLKAAEADVIAGEAAARSADAAAVTAEADLARARAQADNSQAAFDRNSKLIHERLVSQSDYDTAKANQRVDVTSVARAVAALAQLRAAAEQAWSQVKHSQATVLQMKSMLARYDNVLEKFTLTSPLDGIVTNLPMHVGENVVVGIQNSPGSSVATIADMSVITAEVKVDETDIINVKIGQTAEVTIDAVPDKKFHGKVTDIGNTAILRSTGQPDSLSGTSSQEAKDFKVVVTLEDPPDGLRPGFSTTAKVEVARKKGILMLPIQAVTVRTPGQLIPTPETGKLVVPDDIKRDKTEAQGVFVVRGGKVAFEKVKTGITGITDIEVDANVHEGEEVVTGSYKVLRTIRPGAAVKVDNDAGDKPEEAGN